MPFRSRLPPSPPPPTPHAWRSRRYYADETTYLAEVDDENEIARSARLDLLWPTVYINSNDTKAIYVAVELESSNIPAFRYFPGYGLSDTEDTLYSCSDPDSPGTCYNAAERGWYEAAEDAEISDAFDLGEPVIFGPYIDANEGGWLVTLSRAVYEETDPGLVAGAFLGVVGVDVMLEQVQTSIERVNFLETGYSMLVTAEDGTIVSAPEELWDRNTEESTTTLCQLNEGFCEDEDGWETFLEDTDDKVYEFESSDGRDYVLVAAPLNGTFGDEGNGQVSFYILSTVPRSEIYEPAEGMADLIRQSMIEILVITGAVAAATLVAVGIAVCMLSGAITRPIVRMTDAAKSISRDGAKTDVFGNAARSWSNNDTQEGGTTLLEYLLCRGDDEIKMLGREFALMISGLGKRGLAARAVGLEGSAVYPSNPFTMPQPNRAPPSAPVPEDSRSSGVAHNATAPRA